MTGVDDRLDEPSNEAVEADLMIACAYDPNDAWGEYSSDAMIAAWRAGYQNAQGRLRDAQAENEQLRTIGALHAQRAGALHAKLTDEMRTERDATRAALARVTALCDEYRANCDPTSMQARVAEVFRVALQGDANPEATDA